jgi:hypothetical protein
MPVWYGRKAQPEVVERALRTKKIDITRVDQNTGLEGVFSQLPRI